jgi:hypothetical protein
VVQLPPPAAIREGQIDHLGQLKESFTEAEAIRVQFCLHSRLRHQGAHGVMGQVDPVESLSHPFRRLGTQNFAPCPLVRFDLIDD